LEDALSCDDEVLEEVFQHVDPPLNTVIRVPQMFVAKLRHYLGWFLQLALDHGVPVFYWAHQLFADAVKKRYLLRLMIILQLREMNIELLCIDERRDYRTRTRDERSEAS